MTVRRTYNFYILTLFNCLILCACSLDEDPRGAQEEHKAYKDATSLELATVANLYNYIGGNSDSEGLQGTYRGVYDLNTFTTDEAMLPTRGGDWYDGGFWQNLYLHRWTPSDSPLENTWNYLYKVVILCNHAIETLAENKSLLSDAAYNSDVAEVRALRAMFYFYIMDLWGNVPIVTSTQLSVNDVETSDRKDVYQFIVSELEESIPNLIYALSNQPGNYYGRMTQSVALFLLAKLTLNAEVYTGQPQWQKCIDYCNRITQDGYTLADTYASNFAVHNETSVENIFTIPMDKYLYTTNTFKNLFRSRHYSHGSALGFDAENGSVATLATCDAYGYDGEENEDIDIRWYINFYADDVYVDGYPVMTANNTQLVYQPLEVKLDLTGSPYEKTAGARMAKYEIDRTAYADGQLQGNDIVLFRYADVLLMRAEAKVRLGQDGSSDLNAVRSRAGMPLVAATLDNIYRERWIEMMWEGWHRNDMIRFGRFHLAYDQRPQLADEANAHTCLFPIPAGVLAHNNKLKQNQGY